MNAVPSANITVAIDAAASDSTRRGNAANNTSDSRLQANGTARKTSSLEPNEVSAFCTARKPTGEYWAKSSGPASAASGRVTMLRASAASSTQSELCAAY